MGGGDALCMVGYDGINDKQVEEMGASNIIWAEKIRRGYIDRRDVWQAITLTVMGKLEYPLIVLILAVEECNYIMAPILASWLPKAGICRNTPRAIVYGIKEHQDFDIHNLLTTIRMQHI